MARSLFRKAVQQGRSKRRGESYSLPSVEPLSAARTPLADFVNRLLVREIEAGENGTTFTTESVIETPHDIRPHNATDSEPRGHPVIFGADVFEIPEHLSRIEERGQFKIRHDPGQPGAGDMDPLFNTHGYQMLVDKPIDTESPQIVLSAQGTLLEKRHLRADRRLQIRPHDENGPLRLTRKQFFYIELIARIDRMGAVSDIVIQGEMSEELKHSAAMYAGCVSGAIEQEEYLKIIDEAGFKNVEIKKSKRIALPDDLLQKYLTEQGIREYKENLKGIFSITVVGYKN